jgi:hypothetical protein
MLETFIVVAKHYYEESWINWKKLYPVWTFLRALEMTETLAAGETVLAAWFKEACEHNASIDGSYL